MKRVKWAGATLLLLGSVHYIGNHLSNNIDNYVSYVDAQDDLLIAEMP